MKIRGFKRVVAGVAAASGIALGAGVVAPGVASAAPENVNVTPAAASTLKVAQDGNDVSVEAKGAVGGFGCSVVAADAGRALELYADPLSIFDVKAGPGLTLFPNAFFTGKDTATIKNNGVYVVMSMCPGDTTPNVKPIIVPGGIGSVAGAADFGSTVIENPDLFVDLVTLVPKLLGTGS